jgi:hypothetical protein
VPVGTEECVLCSSFCAEQIWSCPHMFLMATAQLAAPKGRHQQGARREWGHFGEGRLSLPRRVVSNH